MTNAYEKIQHPENSMAKVSVVSVRNSAYHWHYDYEILIVLRGRLEIFSAQYGSEFHSLSTGDIILLNSKTIHSIRTIDQDNLCLLLQFAPVYFDPTPAGMSYYFYLNSADQHHQPSCPYSYYIRAAAQAGLWERQNTKEAHLRKHGWLLLLFADLLSSVPHELRSYSSSQEEDIAMAIEISNFIDENILEEKLSILICRKFGLSEKSLYRLLKETVGMTLKEMTDAARIEKACRLLGNPGISLQAVSDYCGYSGEATFYRRFRSAMGVTPGEYRKGFHTEDDAGDIRDYLSFDDSEAERLLRLFAEEGKSTDE